MELTGVVRDFRERSEEFGHPDFERKPDHGFALYQGNVSSVIGDDMNPVFTGEGFKVLDEWRDAEGRPICYLLFDPDRGDTAGTMGPADTGGIESAESFAAWYQDVIGVNMSAPLTLVLHRQPDGIYLFDNNQDPYYQDLGGFFPIEDQLLGNPGGSPDRNFHFTFEIHGTFVYEADAGQIFRFIGDDDIWVFIDGQLVIDLGGVHSSKEQFVDLSRLDLNDGDTYRLDFFFAERHRTESNFRIMTNLLLQTSPPTISQMHD
ncbi:MAG: fibro-slime domain-containing protein [Planctomycetota bacterium]|jgi:fibro-slime domain-containing protein